MTKVYLRSAALLAVPTLVACGRSKTTSASSEIQGKLPHYSDRGKAQNEPVLASLDAHRSNGRD